MSTNLLTYAIARERWDLAALCLVAGVVRAAEELPPDAIEALLELLAEDAPAGGHGRSGKEGRSRGRWR